MKLIHLASHSRQYRTDWGQQGILKRTSLLTLIIQRGRREEEEEEEGEEGEGEEEEEGEEGEE